MSLNYKNILMVFFFYLGNFFQKLFLSESSRKWIKKCSSIAKWDHLAHLGFTYVLPIYQQSNFYVLAGTSNQRRYMIGPIQCKILNKCPWDVCLINETGLNEKLYKVYCTILTAFKISIRWSSTLKFYFFYLRVHLSRTIVVVYYYLH